MPLDGLLVELRGLPLLNRQRALRALTYARAKPVAVYFAHQPRLAIDNLSRALGARARAEAAAVAFRFVNPDDFSPRLHFFTPS
jgi:hypothetical protein